MVTYTATRFNGGNAKPATESEATAVRQDIPECPSTPEKPNRLLPKSTQFFLNDLNDDEKEELVQSLAKTARDMLNQPQVTVNSIARLVGCEHAKAKAALTVSVSLHDFIVSKDTDTRAVNRAVNCLAKLSEEERNKLIAKFSNGDFAKPSDGSTH